MKSRLLLLSLLILPLLVGGLSRGQTGTPHGVQISWTAPAPVGGSGVLAGYNVYRCSGTCTAVGGAWTKIDTSLDLTNGYLDSSTLTPSATYSYTATTVDSLGNESAMSNVATVTLPASLPTNPGPPTGCNAAVK